MKGVKGRKSTPKIRGVPVFSTSVLKDAKATSRRLGKDFYVRPRWFGGFSVFRRK